jgi:hypothetical protein
VPKSWLRRHKAAGGRKQAVLTLRRYFRQMGFERIGRTPYYDLSMARKVTMLADLLRPSQEHEPSSRPQVFSLPLYLRGASLL